MVIEHIFVTTLEPAETMARASEFLKARGFEPTDSGGVFAMDGANEWSQLEMRRGKKKARRAKSIAQLPQMVRVEWDRGRVAVACSIVPSAVWGGKRRFVAIAHDPMMAAGRLPVHSRLLTEICTGLEDCVAHDGSGDSNYTGWDAVESEIAELVRQRRRRTMIRALIVILLFAAVIGLVIFLAMSRH